MPAPRGGKKIKTDLRDAKDIARCLAQHNYSPVHIPTEMDEQTKEFIRMRDDHKIALKKVKQQILAFCLRHGYRYDGNSNWTAAHIKWLRSLQPEALYKEILDEYLLTYTSLSDKIERLAVLAFHPATPPIFSPFVIDISETVQSRTVP
jgi:transposase